MEVSPRSKSEKVVHHHQCRYDGADDGAYYDADTDDHDAAYDYYYYFYDDESCPIVENPYARPTSLLPANNLQVIIYFLYCFKTDVRA